MKGHGASLGLGSSGGGGLRLDIAPDSAAVSGGVMAEVPDPFLDAPVDADVKFRDRDFEFLGELGSGSGGSVSKVRHKPTGAVMARKNIAIFVDAEADRKRAERQLKTELKMVHIIRSEYIVASYGAFSHEGDVAIVMEYMDCGSLDYIYRRTGPIPEPIAARVAVHVLRGLEYLSEKNIVHRDIKPSNILVNSKGQVKIADFGVSKETGSSLAKTFTGTPSYLAPERIQSGSDYSVVSDVWSLGLTLIEICTARPPYAAAGGDDPAAAAAMFSMFDLMNLIQDQPAPQLPSGRFSEDFDDFVATCVIKDHTHRPSPDRLLQHRLCRRVVADGISVAEWALELR
ncbi:Dual specificity mitogen-activated protein kinase kinase dSOR1, partial [Cladochytrium tenue]